MWAPGRQTPRPASRQTVEPPGTTEPSGRRRPGRHIVASARPPGHAAVGARRATATLVRRRARGSRRHIPGRYARHRVRHGCARAPPRGCAARAPPCGAPANAGIAYAHAVAASAREIRGRAAGGPATAHADSKRDMRPQRLPCDMRGPIGRVALLVVGSVPLRGAFARCGVRGIVLRVLAARPNTTQLRPVEGAHALRALRRLASGASHPHRPMMYAPALRLETQRCRAASRRVCLNKGHAQ